MPGHAVPEHIQQRDYQRTYEDLINQAVKVYWQKPPDDCRGYQKVTDNVRAEYNRTWSSRERIELNWTTVRNCVEGMRSITQAWAEDSCTLTPEEANVVAQFSFKMSRRGFGLSLCWIRQHADRLLTATGQLPVGQNWPERFVASCQDLCMQYAQYLEAKCGQAVNPASHEKWFCLLGAILSGNIPDRPEFADLQEDYPDLKPVEPSKIFGFDETNFWTAPMGKERVIGPVDEKVHKQCRGSCETITAVATICADGTDIEPVVIFKGKHFLVQWDQENPLNAL